MTAHIQPMPTLLGPAYIRTARVIRQTSDRIYRVALEGQEEVTARMALPGPWVLHPDDMVLVAGESPASGYIIGLIESEAPRAIRSANGAGARIQGPETHQTITVHDADERVVFEYHPGTGKSVIHAPSGDLTLDAPNGFIGLQAGKGIRCTSGGEVAIKGGQGVHMTVAGTQDGPEQTLDLNGEGVQLGVHGMTVIAGMGDFTVEQAVYRGRKLDSRIDRARMVYDKLETTAQRMWQRSGHFFKQVQHLCQIQTGRMRTLVHGAQHTQSQRTTLIAREDVRIDGQKINLG